MAASEIESAVSALLKSFGVTYGVLPRGEKRDAFGEKGHTMDAWSCSFTKGDGREAHEEFDYFTGIGHRTKPSGLLADRIRREYGRNAERSKEWQALRKPQAPAAAGVLHSLIMDSSACDQSFEDWCSDLGYDTDSRKALQTYLACQEEATKMRRVFTREQIEQLREALQDY